MKMQKGMGMPFGAMMGATAAPVAKKKKKGKKKK